MVCSARRGEPRRGQRRTGHRGGDERRGGASGAASRPPRRDDSARVGRSRPSSSSFGHAGGCGLAVEGVRGVRAAGRAGARRSTAGRTRARGQARPLPARRPRGTGWACSVPKGSRRERRLDVEATAKQCEPFRTARAAFPAAPRSPGCAAGARARSARPGVGALSEPGADEAGGDVAGGPQRCRSGGPCAGGGVQPQPEQEQEGRAVPCRGTAGQLACPRAPTATATARGPFSGAELGTCLQRPVWRQTADSGTA